MAETVTKAIFEAEERGVAKTGAALDRLAGSAGKASAAEAGFAKTSQTVANDLRGVEARIEGVNKRLAGAPAAWSRYESSMRAANDGLKAGRIDAEQFGRTVRDLQSELQRVIAPKVDMSAVDSGLARTLGNTEKVGAAQRILARDMLASAQARQKADAEAARGQAMLVEQAQKLRLEIDPLAAAQTRLNTELAEYQALAARGLISTEELGKATAMANGRFEDMGRRLGAVGVQARLTQNQLLNLSRQGNDVLTMGAMGMPLSMIVATQAGQIYGALEENQRGVRGSLEAIGSSIAGFARAIPPAALAVAGLSAAVGGLYMLTRGSAARSAEESVASFEDAVRSLESAWSGAGDAAEAFYRRATSSAASNPVDAMLDTQAQVRKLQEDYRAAVRALNFDDTLQERIIAPDFGGMSEARREIRDLYAELMRGDIKAADMAARMREIRMDPANEGYTRAFADAIRIALGNAIDLENRINAIGAATEGLSGKGARVFGNPDQSAPWALEDRFGGATSLLDRFDPGSMDAIRDGLRALADALTETDKAATEYAKSLADLRSGWSDSLGDLQRQVEMYGQTEGAIAAARFEHEALAEARKLAADADKLFDENGVDAARIRQVADEIGFLTDQLTGMKEAEQQAKRVRDVLADLQFQGSLIGLSDVEADVARQLNTLKLGHESLDGQRIAGQIRYNDSLQNTQDALEKQRDLMSNIVSTGFDALFDTDKSDSFFDSVMDGLADVGGQFTNDISALFLEDAR